MKFTFLLSLVFILSSSSFAQSLGYNSILFTYPSHLDKTYHYGGGIEYDHKLSSSFDLIVQPAFLYTSSNSESYYTGKSEKTVSIRIPVLGAVRYSPFDFFIKPYASLGGALNYFIYDEFPFRGFKYNDDKTIEALYGPKETNSKILFGFYVAVGAAVDITDSWALNINAFGTGFKDSVPEYKGYNIGINYRL